MSEKDLKRIGSQSSMIWFGIIFRAHMQYNIWSTVSTGEVLDAFIMVLFPSSLKVKLHEMEQLTISLTKWLSIDDECVVLEFGVDFTFFDTEFSWLFIFRFDATLASGGLASK